MICKNSKLSTFKHESEVAERRESSKQFTVKGGVFLLRIRELLGIECYQSPRTVQELLKNCTQVGVRSIHRVRDGNIRLRMNEL